MAENNSQSVFQRMLESMRERRAARKEAQFLASLPKPYADFVRNYTPKTPQEAEMYNKMTSVLTKTVQPLREYSEEFAQIGDASLLRHLWNNARTNDPDLRSAIVNNPECPKDIVLKAISDPFDSVSAPAVMNPALTEKDLLQAVNVVDQTCYSTCKALETRLGELGYQVEWSPWTNEATVHKARVNEQAKETPDRKSFDNLLSDAQRRSATQAAEQKNMPSRNIPAMDHLSR